LGKADKAGFVQIEEEKAKEGMLLLSSPIFCSKDDVRVFSDTYNKMASGTKPKLQQGKFQLDVNNSIYLLLPQ